MKTKTFASSFPETPLARKRVQVKTPNVFVLVDPTAADFGFGMSSDDSLHDHLNVPATYEQIC